MVAEHAWFALFALAGVFSVFSAGHALLNKRDARAALGWVAVCLLLHPAVGALLYWAFGVNRIHTRALKWQRRGHWGSSGPARRASGTGNATMPAMLAVSVAPLVAVSDRIAQWPIVGGNRVVMLRDGEEAYPAMLAAIGSAQRSVYLCTYIFDTDETGTSFIDALGAATRRGCDVRVLVDGLGGALYSFPPAVGRLRKAGVRAAWFLPLSKGIHVNLRNHRKLLFVDGGTGFTGGMNIGGRHLASARANRHRVTDLHFQICGPAARQLEEVFLEDWRFATGDSAARAAGHPTAAVGDAYCRAISDGPNHDFEKLQWILIGVISAARHCVRIMTPYFLPESALIAALVAATLRGVVVEIVLPRENNLPYVAWATQAMLWQLLRHDIRIYFQPPPFAHTKYLLIDSSYALIGSSNLDPRSLRLNFEFNLEIYDAELAAGLGRHFELICARSSATTLAQVDARSLPVRLRDACAKLFTPYL
jgi:cardiolipin synthase